MLLGIFSCDFFQLALPCPARIFWMLNVSFLDRYGFWCLFTWLGLDPKPLRLRYIYPYISAPSAVTKPLLKRLLETECFLFFLLISLGIALWLLCTRLGWVP